MNWSVLALGLTFIAAGVSSALDNWTTYIALTEFAHGARELNPLADFWFHIFGVGTSLIVNSGLCLGAFIFVAQTSWIERDSTRSYILGFVATLRGAAAWNNWLVITALGG